MNTENKNVPVLRFPEFKEEWKEFRLSEALTKYSENNRDEEFSIDEILSLSSHHGIVSRKELLEDTYSNVNHFNYKKTRLNDLVYGKSISASYPFGLFKVNDYKDGLLSTLYFTFKVKESAYPKFLDCYFSHLNRANNYLRKFVLVGDRYITADADFLLSGRIHLPILLEQKKIATFLTTIDEKIQQLAKKKDLLEQYKKGMIQKIFNQEIRFKDDKGNSFADWKVEKLRKILIEYRENSTKNNQHIVLTSSNKGLMKQSEYYGENRITEKDNLGFNIIPNGYITYRSRSDNRKFTFNINNLGITGIISTYYPVFTTNVGSNKFLIEYLNFKQHYIGKYSVGTSQTVLSLNELKNIKLPIPSEPEQKKIADFLSAIDDKINLVNQQLENTKEYKKGLLQQMFI